MQPQLQPVHCCRLSSWLCSCLSCLWVPTLGNMQPECSSAGAAPQCSANHPTSTPPHQGPPRRLPQRHQTLPSRNTLCNTKPFKSTFDPELSRPTFATSISNHTNSFLLTSMLSIGKLTLMPLLRSSTVSASTKTCTSRRLCKCWQNGRVIQATGCASLGEINALSKQKVVPLWAGVMCHPSSRLCHCGQG